MADLISTSTNSHPIRWLSGVVLAGGESRRMGQHKAWLSTGGETLLARTVRTVSHACSKVIVVGTPGQDLPAVPAIITRDAVAGEGPLRGIEAGITAARTHAVFVCAVDVPFLKVRLASFLADHLEKFQAVVPRWDGHVHPLQAIYAVEVLPVIQMLLRKGNRRLTDLLAQLQVCYMEEDSIRGVDPQGASFINVNTPRDWEAVLKQGLSLRSIDRN